MTQRVLFTCYLAVIVGAALLFIVLGLTHQ
jgi:hypothetical protein